MKVIPKKIFYNLKEVAELFNKDTRTIKSWIKNKDPMLDGIKPNKSGQYKFIKKDVDEIIYNLTEKV